MKHKWRLNREGKHQNIKCEHCGLVIDTVKKTISDSIKDYESYGMTTNFTTEKCNEKHFI
jgi:hypothetical protein